jgi:acetyltransferase-like isoleucine patch superfamily enzyme
LGSQIQTFAVVETESVLGIQCIVNTKASVDHECVLGDGTEMAPGATLCGCITTEKNAWICAGATVLPRIHIGENSIIGAGSVVIEDVPDNTTVIGVPAKPLIRNKNKT